MLYKVDMKYVRNLSHVDDKVLSVSPQQGKENRPFVGIILICDKKEYCIPLSSPKPKHENMKNDLDFSKILDNNNKLIGVLNFNLMIPIEDSVLTPVDLNYSKNLPAHEIAYRELMKDQLNWCQSNEDNIVKKANKLYKFVTETPEKSRNLTRRCCDFKKLECVLEKYLSKKEPDLQIKNDSYINNKKKKRILYDREKGRKAAQQISIDKNDIKHSKDNPTL